eukprot:11220397-Lingulodinium_polyedra.AAC.1
MSKQRPSRLRPFWLGNWKHPAQPHQRRVLGGRLGRGGAPPARLCREAETSGLQRCPVVTLADQETVFERVGH